MCVGVQVNGVSVKGKSQAEVVVLLKSSDRVSLVVSRQEVVDSQDEVRHTLSLSLSLGIVLRWRMSR